MSGSGNSAEDLGFGREYRLLTPAEFSAVFTARRVLRGTQFALHYRSNGRSGARLGLVIPKKQARLAVLRNAIKRQARECFRQRQQRLPPVDLVLRLVRSVTNRGAATDPRARAAWRAEIVALFDRLDGRPAP